MRLGSLSLCRHVNGCVCQKRLCCSRGGFQVRCPASKDLDRKWVCGEYGEKRRNKRVASEEYYKIRIGPLKKVLRGFEGAF